MVKNPSLLNNFIKNRRSVYIVGNIRKTAGFYDGKVRGEELSHILFPMGVGPDGDDLTAQLLISFQYCGIQGNRFVGRGIDFKSDSVFYEKC